MRIVFFGSFQHYSALILKSLIDHPRIEVVGVVTTPPMPVGRKQIITKTPVHLLAEQHHIPVFTPTQLPDDMNLCRQLLFATQGSEAELIAAERSRVESKSNGEQMNDRPDYFITAGYGKILPESWLKYPKQNSLNLHFSLLPAYRGANPAEWAIMCGETKTGITLIEMSDKLDGGNMINQAEIPISNQDTRETLYEKLYALGAEKLPEWLCELCRHVDLTTQGSEAKLIAAERSRVESNTYVEQPKKSPTPYAALLKRDDGFIPWSAIQNLSPTLKDFPSKHLQRALLYAGEKYGKYKSMEGMGGEKNNLCRHVDLTTQGSEAELIAAERSRVESNTYVERMFLCRLPRALAGYPSLWTIVNTTKGGKRMKIISFDPYIIVQLEGGQPTHFNQIKNIILK